MARFTIDEIKKNIGQSDRVKIVEMTYEEVHQDALNDPDCQPLTEEQLSQFRRVVPKGNGVYGHSR